MYATRFSRFAALSVAILVSVSCGGSDALTVPSEGLPSEITVLSGNGQEGVVGQPLSDSLVVRLTDSKDRPVQGQRVQFSIVAGGSSALLLPEMATTDIDGTARARWVLGAEAGEQRVQAKVVSRGSLTAAFTATAAAEDPDSLVQVSGEDQTGIVRGLLKDSLVVAVTDAFGNPLQGQTVTWQVPQGQGSVSAPTTVTGPDGHAAVTRILGAGAGDQSTRATVGSLPGQLVTFHHTAIAGHAVDLVMLSVDPQTAPAGSRLTDSLVVQARDGDGNGVPGEVITWVPSFGGSAAPTLSVTDAEGKAFTYWTLKNQGGTNTLTAAGFGSSVVYHATGVSNDPDTVRALSPTSFTATAGQPVGPAQLPSVRVSDPQGNPVQGVSVTFAVISGGGIVTDANASGTSVAIPTDATGTAKLAGWTLGSALGAQTVTASANRPGGSPLEGSPVSFTATAQAGAGANLVFGQQPTNTAAGATITPPVTVIVTDQFGNPVTSASTTVTLTFGNNPGSATLSGTTSGTPVNGTVTFGNLSIDKTGSGYTLVAHASGLTDVSSASFSVVQGAANRLVFLNQPGNMTAGETIAPALQVAIQDAAGNTVTSASDSIVLTLTPASGGLGGVTRKRAGNGVATFNQVTVGVAGNGYTISASSPGSSLASATSNGFNVEPGVPPVLHLAFTRQPSNAKPGEVISPSVRVSILDQDNHVYTQATNPITMTLGNNPLNLATLNGTLTVIPVNGVADFPDLSVTGLTALSNLSLLASASGFESVESRSFNVR